jgi:hypothetical protein
MRASSSRILAVVVTLATPAPVLAQQFVAVDKAYVHTTANAPGAHYRTSLKSQPADWTAPVDYRLGKVYARVEVLSKPSAEPTRISICFEGKTGYGCLGTPSYTTTGVIEWSLNFTQMSFSSKTVDWSQRPYDVAIILEDSKHVRIDATKIGDARAALFLPTMLRVAVTFVAAGATYMPPAPSTDAGIATTTDAGMSVPKPARDGGAEAGTSAPDGAALGSDPDGASPSSRDAGASDTGAGMEPGGPRQSPASAPKVPSMIAPADDGEIGPTPASRQTSGGCAVAGRDRASALGLIVAAAALALGMRRRRPRRDGGSIAHPPWSKFGE